MTTTIATLITELRNAEADVKEATARTAKWDARHEAAELGTYEAELSSRCHERAYADYRDAMAEVRRIGALIIAQSAWLPEHCENCPGTSAEALWVSGPARNGGVEVQFGLCDTCAEAELDDPEADALTIYFNH